MHDSENSGATEWEFADPCSSLEGSLNIESFWQSLREVAPKLSNRSLQFLRLSFRGGYTHVDIAEQFGVKVAVVDKDISRTLRTITLSCLKQGISRTYLSEISPPP